MSNRQGMIDKVKKHRLYMFIVEYRSSHNGESPSLAQMAEFHKCTVKYLMGELGSLHSDGLISPESFPEVKTPWF